MNIEVAAGFFTTPSGMPGYIGKFRALAVLSEFAPCVLSFVLSADQIRLAFFLSKNGVARFNLYFYDFSDENIPLR